MQTKVDTDLIVRSFAYVAKQLAPSSQYEQIVSEAEKHRSALRLLQREAIATGEQVLRQRALTPAEFLRLRAGTEQTIARALQQITRIAMQYAPHKLAA